MEDVGAAAPLTAPANFLNNFTLYTLHASNDHTKVIIIKTGCIHNLYYILLIAREISMKKLLKNPEKFPS
jgi:hypothetical protein